MGPQFLCWEGSIEIEDIDDAYHYDFPSSVLRNSWLQDSLQIELGHELLCSEVLQFPEKRTSVFSGQHAYSLPVVA